MQVRYPSACGKGVHLYAGGDAQKISQYKECRFAFCRVSEMLPSNLPLRLQESPPRAPFRFRRRHTGRNRKKARYLLRATGFFLHGKNVQSIMIFHGRHGHKKINQDKFPYYDWRRNAFYLVDNDGDNRQDSIQHEFQAIREAHSFSDRKKGERRREGNDVGGEHRRGAGRNSRRLVGDSRRHEAHRHRTANPLHRERRRLQVRLGNMDSRTFRPQGRAGRRRGDEPDGTVQSPLHKGR